MSEMSQLLMIFSVLSEMSQLLMIFSVFIRNVRNVRIVCFAWGLLECFNSFDTVTPSMTTVTPSMTTVTPSMTTETERAVCMAHVLKPKGAWWTRSSDSGDCTAVDPVTWCSGGGDGTRGNGGTDPCGTCAHPPGTTDRRFLMTGLGKHGNTRKWLF